MTTTALPSQAMTVPALFILQHQSPLQFERRTPLDILDRGGCRTPGIHLW